MNTSLGMWLLAGALIASAGLNAHLATRSAPPAEPCAKCPREVRPDVEGLGLTEGQCNRLTSCCRQQTPTEQDHAADVKACCKELEALLASSDSDFDVAKAEELADRIGTAQARLLKSRIKTIRLVRDELTPDQIATLIRDSGQN